MTRQSGSMSRYSMNVHASRYTPASAGLGVLNWLAIVPDEPPRAKGIYLWTPPRPKDLALSSLTPLLVTQLVLGGIVRSSLARLAPTSYLSVAYGGSLPCSYPSVFFLELFAHFWFYSPYFPPIPPYAQSTSP